MTDTYMIIAIVILIAFSAIFSATETAFNTFNRVRMKNLAADGNKKAARVLNLSDDYDALLSTVLIGNNIVNIGLTAIATVLFVKWLGNGSGPAASTAVTTVLVLIFGEISPKAIAKENPDGYAMSIAPVINVLTIVFAPINAFFRLWKKMLSKLFGLKKAQAMTEEELITIVDEVVEDGGINEQEGELIRSAIEFTDADVETIITPRVDVIAFDIETPCAEIAAAFYETGFSRIPVYEETIDNIIGVLHEKDFYHEYRKGDFDITNLLKKPFMITSHVKISRLLTQFQQAKTHMAIVLDDYGGTMGIVTLEDVIEELVGDIYDEHDEVDEEQITEISDDTVLLSGDMRTLDLFERFDMTSDDEEELPQTVSGLVTMCLGEFPEVGNECDFENLHFEVIKTDGMLVEEVKVTLTEGEDTEEDEKE